MSQPSLHTVLAAAGLLSSGLATAHQPEAQSLVPGDAPAASLPEPEEAPRNLAVWLGHVESDNLARTVVAEDGSYETLGLLLGLGRMSPRLSASIDADLEHRQYSLDTLDDETIGSLNAAAEVHIVRDRFSWAFTDDYGQGLTDPFSGIGPGNREEINAISTGPRLFLPFGGRTSLEISGTYSERRFDESNNVDNDSVLTELGLYRQTSSTARFGLVANSNNIEYVDVIAPDYQIDRFTLRYEKELATGRVVADVGENRISAGRFESDEPSYHFVWTRSLTARSDLNIRAAREYTDSGAAPVPGLDDQGFNNAIVSPNPFEQTRFDVSYVLNMSRTVVSAEIGSWEEDYVGNVAFDNESTAVRLSFVRTISPRLSFGVGYDSIKREFTDAATIQTDSDDSWAGAWLSRTLGRRFNLGLAISSYDRSGVQDYDERRYELRFGYSPTESGAAAMASVGR